MKHIDDDCMECIEEVNRVGFFDSYNLNCFKCDNAIVVKEGMRVHKNKNEVYKVPHKKIFKKNFPDIDKELQ